METIIIDEQEKLVENESSKNSDLEILLDKSLNNTVSIDKTFYQKDDKHYAILCHEDVTKYCYPNTGFTHLELYGFISRIELHNFPNTQHILQFNCKNVATSIYDKDGIYYFDIPACIEKNSKFLESLEDLTRKSLESINGSNYFNDPNVQKLINGPEGKDYVNTFYIGNGINIIVPKSTQFEYNKKMEIVYYKYVMENEKWIEIQKVIDIYPHVDNTLLLGLNNPTESIDIKVSGKGKVYLYLNSEKCIDMDVDNNLYRLKMDMFYCIETHNKYLSDEINRETMNLSRIDSIKMVTIDCKIINMYQNFYKIYHYPSRQLAFTC